MVLLFQRILFRFLCTWACVSVSLVCNSSRDAEPHVLLHCSQVDSQCVRNISVEMQAIELLAFDCYLVTLTAIKEHRKLVGTTKVPYLR